MYKYIYISLLLSLSLSLSAHGLQYVALCAVHCSLLLFVAVRCNCALPRTCNRRVLQSKLCCIRIHTIIKTRGIHVILRFTSWRYHFRAHGLSADFFRYQSSAGTNSQKSVQSNSI